jgi:hypothetical protein
MLEMLEKLETDRALWAIIETRMEGVGKYIDWQNIFNI